MTVSSSSPNDPSVLTIEERVIRSRRGWAALNLRELWLYRELFLFLAWRDILVRYKQTALGVAWAVLQPFLTMVVLTVVFGKMAKFPSGNVPYALNTLAALLPWQFFANALAESSNSLLASSNMISKIYFPRLIIPVSSVLSGLIDFLISLALLVVMLFWYHVPLRPQMLLFPVFLFGAFASAFMAGIWLSSLNVKYRDVKYVVPFFTRMGLYICPVGFSSAMVLDHFGPKIHFLYSLNPIVGVIDGFRWCIFGEPFSSVTGFAASMLLVAGVSWAGLLYFRSMEKTFADEI